jgi:hypothetical protein
VSDMGASTKYITGLRYLQGLTMCMQGRGASPSPPLEMQPHS